MKLRLQTLSPLHIGTGEELAPMDYVVYKSKFYRISEKQFTDWVEQIIPGEEGLLALSNWVSEEYAIMREIRDNRELSRRNHHMNPYQFFATQKKESEFGKILQQLQGSQVIFDERTEKRAGRSPIVSLGQVRGMIKNAKEQPYLPGSSIKGALRSAIFYHYLTHFADIQEVSKFLSSQQKRRARKERFSLPLIQEAFYCATRDNQRNRLNTRDEKMDLMKLIRIPDAHIVTSDTTYAQLAKVNIYLVETPRPKHQRDQRGEKIAVQQPQASYCEIVPMGQVLETDLDFDIDFLLQVKPFLKNDAISAGKDQHWIGLSRKVQQLFGLDLSSLNKANKSQKKKEVIQHLLQVWKVFSQRQLKRQEEWLNHFRTYDRRGYSQQITRGLDPIKAQSHATLLHLGYGTGFTGTTALLYFVEDNQQLRPLYKGILEQFKIGNKPGNRGRYSLNLDQFPKSRRLVEDENGNIRPLGWLQWMDDPEARKIPQSDSANSEANEETVVKPEFYSGTLNYKKPPLLEAIITKSGRPNQVQVFVSPDKMPTMQLNGYRNPMEEGTVVIVQAMLNKKGKILQISFRAKKG